MRSLAPAVVGTLLIVAAPWVAGPSLAQTSFAQPKPEAIGWTYRASPECPSGEAFRREFRARTARADLVDDAPDATRSFAVTLMNEPNRAVGRIEIGERGGVTATREVVGRTCRGVVTALALIAALAVDPMASAGPTSDVAPRPLEPPPPETRVPVGGEAETSGGVAVGADGGAVFGLFPKPAPRLSVFADVRARRASLFAPSLRLSASAAATSSTAAPPGSATFHWLAAELDACPLLVRLVPSLRAVPCVVAEAGVLTGEGAGVSAPTVENRRWFALGASARLEWILDGSIFLEARGGFEAPLARDTFVLQAPARVVVHAVPAFVGDVGIGVGFRWP